MKAVLVAVALLAVTPLAGAQTVPAPVSRADVTGTLGWLSENKAELTEQVRVEVRAAQAIAP